MNSTGSSAIVRTNCHQHKDPSPLTPACRNAPTQAQVTQFPIPRRVSVCCSQGHSHVLTVSYGETDQPNPPPPSTHRTSEIRLSSQATGGP
jgi:hypothetical protein